MRKTDKANEKVGALHDAFLKRFNASNLKENVKKISYMNTESMKYKQK